MEPNDTFDIYNIILLTLQLIVFQNTFKVRKVNAVLSPCCSLLTGCGKLSWSKIVMYPDQRGFWQIHLDKKSVPVQSSYLEADSLPQLLAAPESLLWPMLKFCVNKRGTRHKMRVEAD